MKLPPVYAILDGACLAQRGLRTAEAAEVLLEGGIRLMQFRWKGEWTRDVYAEAKHVAQLCRSASCEFIVNDRADVALLLSAGVHVGQDDLPAGAVRDIVPGGRLVGLSTHNEAQFREALETPADYIAIGPVFGTTSKERPDPVVGIQELHRLRPLSDRPVVAIGGITRERARDVWEAGADSIAVISDLFPEECTRRSVHERVQEWITLAAE